MSRQRGLEDPHPRPAPRPPGAPGHPRDSDAETRPGEFEWPRADTRRLPQVLAAFLPGSTEPEGHGRRGRASGAAPGAQLGPPFPARAGGSVTACGPPRAPAPAPARGPPASCAPSARSGGLGHSLRRGGGQPARPAPPDRLRAPFKLRRGGTPGPGRGRAGAAHEGEPGLGAARGAGLAPKNPASLRPRRAPPCPTHPNLPPTASPSWRRTEGPLAARGPQPGRGCPGRA